MPRRPRIHLDGVPLHIVQRGHNREACFFGEEDYQAYLHWLGEALKKERCALHAYALMTNHVHLLVTPERAEAVPRLVIALGRRYVQYINTTYRRSGTLWDSRYKSSLIQAETYLIRLALNQNQPLGNSRFHARIEAMTGQRREARPRGRPRVRQDESGPGDAEQGELGL